MNFRAEFTPKSLAVPIRHTDRLLLIGSCFTENIGSMFARYKFRVTDNPHGILFNPVSIADTLGFCIAPDSFSTDHLFYANECWNSWKHHTRFSKPDQSDCLAGIQAAQQQAHHFLQYAQWVVITLGSAFVYELSDGSVAANCHKIPTDKFKKRLLPVPEIEAVLNAALQQLVTFNPGIQVMLTISPVRHLRDGFIENNRSKAHLIQAVHQLVEQHSQVHYFPSYELVIDDLRDYRFYAEDLAHPNYAATRYVWEKLVQTCIEPATQSLMEAINVINAARHHKPFQPTSQQHRQFLQVHLQKALQLKEKYPYLNLEEEIQYFNAQP